MSSRDTTTNGVVIGRTSAGEGSVRAHLYTETLGLVAAIAKSAREERSKLRAHLTTGTSGTFTLIKGEHGWRVTGAVKTHSSHFGLAHDSVAASSAGASKAKQEASARVIAVVRSLALGEGANPELFHALWEFLVALPSLSSGDVCTAEQVAVVRILSALGYVAPEIDMPGLATCTYSPSALAPLTPLSERLVATINKGLTASGLV